MRSAKAFLTSVFFCALLPAYGQVVVTSTQPSGPGSFSEAVASVSAGGTIRFAPALAHASIQCNSISIGKLVTIDGTGVRPALVLTDIDATLEIQVDAEVTIVNTDVMIPVVNRGSLEAQSLTVGGLGMTGIDNKAGAHLTLFSSKFVENTTDVRNEGGTVTATSNQFGFFLNETGTVTALSNTFNGIQNKAGQFAATNCVIDAEFSNDGVAIEGGSFTAEQVTIAGNDYYDADVGLKIATNGIVRLNNCRIFNFAESGIQNKGALWATNCLLTNNAATPLRNLASGSAQIESCVFNRNLVDSSYSGAIENGGTLILNNSFVTANRNWGDAGGILNHAGASLSMTNTVISGNLGANGCGIFNDGTITAQSVRIEGNSYDPFGSSGYGGAIYSRAGSVTLSDCKITGNRNSSGGGIVKAAGDLTLIRTVVSNNSSSQFSFGSDCTGGIGAAIWSWSGRVTLVECSVVANQTVGVFCRSPDDNTYNTEGGAGGISVTGNLEIYRSTIASNIGNGISHGGGILTVVQSTIAGNSESGQRGGTFDQSESGGFGGGILASGVLRITNCTIFGNFAARPSSNAKGGGIYFTGTDFSLQNSIVCSNRADLNPDIFGSFTGDHNLVGVDPKLGPLATNGGLTQTMLPIEGSPAIDAASYAGFPTDQRGFPSMVSLLPDIGATETGDARPLAITAEFGGSGNVTIRFRAVSGARFQIFTTPMLNVPVSAWESIGPASEKAGGAENYEFTYSAGPQSRQRFFAIIPQFN